MNQKFKLKVFAVLVTFSGSLLGHCHAIPQGASDNGYSLQGHPQRVSQSAFGAVTPAVPPASYSANENYPPIVSAAEALTNPPISAPPIASVPSDIHVTPVVSAPVAGTATPIQPPNAASNTYSVSNSQSPLPSNAYAESRPASKSDMLAPIVSQETTQALQEIPKATSIPAAAASDDTVSPVQWNQPTNQHVGVPVDGVSSAGIPLYPRRPLPSNSSQSSKPIATNNQPTLTPPVISGTVVTPRTQSNLDRLPTGDPSTGTNTPIIQNYPSTQLADPSATQPRVTPASAKLPTSRTYFNKPAQEAPVLQGGTGYDSTGYGANGTGYGANGTGYGANGTYGVNGTYGADNYGAYGGNTNNKNNDPNYVGPKGSSEFDYIHDQDDYFGSITGARWYVEAEGMYIDRTDGTIVNSNFGSLGDFEANFGVRITAGRRKDVTRGFEISFLGSAPLKENATRIDADGRLEALFNFDVLTVDDNPFFAANIQFEEKETDLYAIEINKVTWGWDVVKAYWGARIFYVNDEYGMISSNSDGDVGNYNIRAQNVCIGPHIGSEWFFDVGYRFSFSYFGKLGVFANPNRVETFISQVGVALSDSRDENVTIGGYGELAFTAHYQITRRIRARFGYTALYLENVAGASDNQPVVLNAQSFVNSSDSGQMFFNGVSVGMEFYR